jgi:hypothetical protein
VVLFGGCQRNLSLDAYNEKEAYRIAEEGQEIEL